MFEFKTNGIVLKGAFEGTLIHPDGTKKVTRKDNMIVDMGFKHILERVFGDATDQTQRGSGTYYADVARPHFIAVGTGTTAPKATDEKLEAFLLAGQCAAKIDAANKKASFFYVFQPGQATGAITEAAVCFKTDKNVEKTSELKADSVYGILDRVVFPVINKGEEDVYTVKFEFTFGEMAKE
jgi:hypothetical protein